MNGGRAVKAYSLMVLFFMVGGCATVADDGGVEDTSIEACISEQGQRFLTFCASKDAAELASRQHTIERGTDDEDRAEDMVPLSVDGAPVRGDRDAAMTVHLFSDLACSDCRGVYNRLAAEVDTRPGEMRLVFRHAPRDNTGESVARAAIAAGEQGKFWEFVDELYANEEAPSVQNWTEVAASVELDVEQWEIDRRSPMIDALLERDALHGEARDVVDAPTFFVNGIRNVGAVAIQEFDEIVRREAEHVEAMEDAGLVGAEISWRRILQNYQPVDWDNVDAAQQELEEGLSIAHVPVGTSPQRGSVTEQSLVTVVVFADFECPYSAQSARVWSQLLERYGPMGLRVAFKHFPLAIHDHSEVAAAASILAADGGVFWEFHDSLFFGDVEAEMSSLAAELRRLGWAGEGFAAAVTADDVEAEIAEDVDIGRQAGVEGTPTVFINGIQLRGLWTVEELAPLIEDQLSLAMAIGDLTESQGDELYRELVDVNRGE